jgi:hypothetical protein
MTHQWRLQDILKSSIVIQEGSSAVDESLLLWCGMIRGEGRDKVLDFPNRR